MKRVPLAAAGAALLLAGCASVVVLADSASNVRVVDDAGAPVPGARVTPTALSINGDAVTTDARGEVRVPETLGVQAVTCVYAAKEGYASGFAEKKTRGETTVVIRRL